MNNISAVCLDITVNYLNNDDLYKFSQTSSFIRSIAQPVLADRRITLIFKELQTVLGLLDKDIQSQLKTLDELKLKPIEKLKHLKVIIVTACFKTIANSHWFSEHSNEFKKRKNIDDKIVFLKSILNKEIESTQKHLVETRAPLLTLLLSLSRKYTLFAIDDGTYTFVFYDDNLGLITTQILLEWGANPNGIPTKKKEGGALAKALVNNKEKHLTLLKKYGAQPDVLYQGQTALQIACFRKPNIHTLGKFLELFHPNPFFKDSRSHTPKDIIRYHRDDPERYLLLANYEKQYSQESGRIKELFSKLF